MTNGYLKIELKKPKNFLSGKDNFQTSHSLLYVMPLIMSCINTSLLVDNTFPTLSLEVKPTEVSSELVSQMTHSMMEGNRKEGGKKNRNDNNVNEKREG